MSRRKERERRNKANGQGSDSGTGVPAATLIDGHNHQRTLVDRAPLALLDDAARKALAAPHGATIRYVLTDDGSELSSHDVLDGDTLFVSILPDAPPSLTPPTPPLPPAWYKPRSRGTAARALPQTGLLTAMQMCFKYDPREFSRHLASLAGMALLVLTVGFAVLATRVASSIPESLPPPCGGVLGGAVYFPECEPLPDGCVEPPRWMAPGLRRAVERALDAQRALPMEAPDEWVEHAGTILDDFADARVPSRVELLNATLGVRAVRSSVIGACWEPASSRFQLLPDSLAVRFYGLLPEVTAGYKLRTAGRVDGSGTIDMGLGGTIALDRIIIPHARRLGWGGDDIDKENVYDEDVVDDEAEPTNQTACEGSLELIRFRTAGVVGVAMRGTDFAANITAHAIEVLCSGPLVVLAEGNETLSEGNESLPAGLAHAVPAALALEANGWRQTAALQLELACALALLSVTLIVLAAGSLCCAACCPCCARPESGSGTYAFGCCCIKLKGEYAFEAKACGCCCVTVDSPADGSQVARGLPVAHGSKVVSLGTIAREGVQGAADACRRLYSRGRAWRLPSLSRNPWVNLTDDGSAPP